MSGATDRPATVLVVEDEALLRLVAVETLSDAGYDVREAGDGNTALDILQTDARIDLLLSDIKMPGMNGYQLASAGLALRPDLKILLMTGYALDPVPEEILNAGIEMLYKPFDIDELPVVAARVLAQR